MLPSSKQAQGFRRSRRWPCSPVRMVVLDLNMPDMHGLDVLGFLRSHGQYRALPVMVLTTRGDDVSRDAALEAGASSYMTKPFSPNSWFHRSASCSNAAGFFAVVTMTATETHRFGSSFMDDYFAEADEHLLAVRRSLLMLESASSGQTRSSAVLEELFRSCPFPQGHLGDGRAARSRSARPPHGELSARGSRNGQAALTPANLETLVAGANALEAVIARGARAASHFRAGEQAIERFARMARPQVDDKTRPDLRHARLSRRVVLERPFVPSPELVARGVKVDTMRARLLEIGQIVSRRSAGSSRRRHRLRVQGARPTTRRVSRPGRTTGSRTSQSRLPSAELASRNAAGDGVGARASSLGGDVCRAGQLRPRGPRSARRTDAHRRRPGRHAIAARRYARRVERHDAVARVARLLQEHDAADGAPTARSARGRHARPSGPGRRDLPPDAVRRPRPRARHRQARDRSRSPVRARRSTSSSSNG